ncbi:MAG: chemotaxis protein methyltransferase CheR [Pseudohongiellaceae bacterium]
MELGAKHIQREFIMTDADFKSVSDLAYEFTGIVLGPQKRDMVYGRLARRLRDLGLTYVVDYIKIVKNDCNQEVSRFINAITTNLTSFYREEHHFDFISTTLIPELKKTNEKTKKIRAWSAGCSTGEEPYSLAITFKENMDLQDWDLKILATDLDSQALNKGQQGIYDLERIESIKPSYKKKWFLKDKNQPDVVKVKPEIQALTKFKRLNLLEEWPMKGPFDFIFCRNVVIYFNAETQSVLFDRYADMLKDGGYLIIGHSESLDRGCHRFRSIGKTIYQKIS